MKKLINLVLALMLISLSNKVNSQIFQTDWSNNYSNWIGGWYISNNDVYIPANLYYSGTHLDFKNILHINKANGWAMVTAYILNFNNPPFFNSCWGNEGSGMIGDWNINSEDKYIPLYEKNSGRHRILAINSNQGHAELLTFNPNQPTSWNNSWNNYTNWIGAWCINNDDRELTGNFEYSSDDYELLHINTRTGWIMVQKYSGNQFSSVYNNSGSGNFGGWIMRNDDIYLAGDLDGDNKSDLIAINKNTGCSAVFKMINGNMTSIWYNNCNSNVGLGGWNTFYNTQYIIHNFNNDLKEEIMFVNPVNNWCTIKIFDPTQQYWPDYYCNYGSGWIGGWHINSADKYVAGNLELPNSNIDNVLFINQNNGLAILTKTNTNLVINADNISLNNTENIQIFPNPFNMQTKLSVSLKKVENVKIIIFDILGKEIKLVNNSVLSKGTHSFVWDGTDNNNNILSSGNYFVKVISESSMVTKRLVINK